MGKRALFSAYIFSATLIGSTAFANSVQIDVALSPAGSFKAETRKVTGSAHRTADGIEAEGVVIDMKSLTTGISLRDKHTKEHLLVDKYPQAKLVKATGRNGKGKATIEVRGKTQEVAGTYTIEGNMLKAEFPMKLSDLDIQGVRYMAVGVKDEVKVHIELPLSQGRRGTASVKRK
jgi:hypothetical protein